MITVDTNVLVRAATLDDPEQAMIAARIFREGDGVAVSISALCEYVWVLRTAYRRSRNEIIASVRALVDSPNVRTDQLLVGKGLAMLEKGGDFADGVIAFEGQWLGGDEFVTFDRKAANLLPEIGIPARCLTSE